MISKRTLRSFLPFILAISACLGGCGSENDAAYSLPSEEKELALLRMHVDSLVDNTLAMIDASEDIALSVENLKTALEQGMALETGTTALDESSDRLLGAGEQFEETLELVEQNNPQLFTSGKSVDDTRTLNFDELLQQLDQYEENVETTLAKLQSQPGSVDLQTMMQLQYSMQMMSQYIEAISNSLSAVHDSMMALARAIKGN